MIIGAAAALATIIASRVINLRVNTKILTDFAEKGYVLKKGPTAEEALEAKNTFKNSLHDVNFLSFIPLVNIGYALVHGTHKYEKQNIIFAELAAKHQIEKIDKMQSDALKAIKESKRDRTMMRWNVRDNLGLDTLSRRDIAKATGAKKGGKKPKEPKMSKEEKNRQELLRRLKELSNDPIVREEILKMQGLNSDGRPEEKGRSR